MAAYTVGEEELPAAARTNRTFPDPAAASLIESGVRWSLAPLQIKNTVLGTGFHQNRRHAVRNAGGNPYPPVGPIWRRQNFPAPGGAEHVVAYAGTTISALSLPAATA